MRHGEHPKLIARPGAAHLTTMSFRLTWPACAPNWLQQLPSLLLGGVMTDSGRETRLRRELSDEAQRIAIDAEYTGRQHIMAGQAWRGRATKIGLPAAILGASVGSGAAGLTALFGADPR